MLFETLQTFYGQAQMPYEIAYPLTEDAIFENFKFDSVQMQMDQIIVKSKKDSTE
jgi:hypothetical protein